MRITVDIDEGVLNDLVAITGETKKSPAISRAVEDFVKRSKMKEFGRLLMEGAFADAFDPDYDPESESVKKTLYTGKKSA